MPSDDDIDAMVRACIKAARHVDESGSRELRTLMRLVLYQLGTEQVRALKARDGVGSATDGKAEPPDGKLVN